MAKYTAKKVIEALREAGGVQSDAALALGCHRNTIGYYIRNHKTVRDAYGAIVEARVDQAETFLMNFVEGKIDGQSARDRLDAVKFYLRTKGRARGYGDRLDVRVQQEVEREMVAVFDTLKTALSPENYLLVLHAIGGSVNSEAAA